MTKSKTTSSAEKKLRQEVIAEIERKIEESVEDAGEDSLVPLADVLEILRSLK